MTETEVVATKRSWWRRPAVIIPIGLVVIVAGALAMAVFQPWKLFVNQVVDEPVPVAAPRTPGAGGSPAQPRGPRTLAAGEFIGQEHDTTGSAQILELADGSRVLRLVDLATSNGPELEVWLAAAPVRGGTDGWFVFDDGPHVSLGPLKGNVGNQNYPIPADIDIRDYSAVSIWCARFRVSFGAAELAPAK